MSEPLTRFDPCSAKVLKAGAGRIAVAAPEARAHAAHAEGIAAAIWGRPAFADDRLSAIAAQPGGPAAALIHAFRDRGPQCLSALRGTFAIALVDQGSGETLLAVDRMGVSNLVYALTAHGLVFGSTALAIRAHPWPATVPDWQSIYDYVHFHMVPGPRTAFAGEQRLLPGQYLHVRNGTTRVEHYWRMRFVEDSPRPFAELRDEFLAHLTRAVGSMATAHATGAFLSGGTDSSTISGLLGKVTGSAANTFSIGFDEPGYDEMEYARIAARHFATAQHEYYVKPEDIVDALPRLAAIYDQPFGNSSAVPTYCCAKFARATGMTHMLGGDGGDELFGGNERYATQQMFALYQGLPAALRSGLLEPLARRMPGAAAVPPIRWFRRGIELASTPMPDRMDAHNLLLRLGAENVFTPDFLATVDRNAPRDLMREVYDGVQAGSLINRMLGYDFRFTLADSDLPKVVKSCELAGVSVDFPMLDDGLVDFSATLVPSLKLKGRKLRYFFKEALRGFLPDEIITKTKHGFGLPFGPWLRSHRPLQAIVMDHLSGLRKRGFVRDDFLDKLMGQHLAEHPGYYGTMAWVLMMLEFWFRNHCDQIAVAAHDQRLLQVR
jgi:asparagine synthase (glutamine-hydrolysing)